ncbi:MAG: AraC family transcriptional regulator [Lachnospiraceae bacterium]|nr:AraC family transcriptional regulator [Lachnospiraceae bacterium]
MGGHGNVVFRESTGHGTVFLPLQVYRFKEEYDQFFVSHHWHDEIEILFFEKGDFQFEREMVPEEIKEGDIVFVGRSVLHQIAGRALPSLHHAVIFDLEMLKFDRYDMAQASILAPLWNGECVLPGRIGRECEGYQELLAELKEIFCAWEEKKPGWYLRVKAKLLLILSVLEEHGHLQHMGRAKKTEDSYQMREIKNVLKYMEEHYKEKVTLSDLAGEAGMNEQYFCRFFRKMTGKTPITYLNDYRIGHAAEALVKSDARIVEICYENGFENVSYFIRKFKEAKGMTPKEYRKRETLV